MHLATIIVHYQEEQNTIDCIASLLQSTTNNLIIVVCNTIYEASQGLYATLCTQFPHACISTQSSGIQQGMVNILVLCQGKNDGYAKACNVGMKTCLEFEHITHIWLLNNDTAVAQDAPQILHEFLELHPLHIVGTAVFTMDAPETLELALGSFFSPLTSICKANMQEDVATQSATSIDYVYGASVAFSVDLLKYVGFFDEQFFLYYEEHDFCLRAKKLGYAFAWCSAAHVWHKGSASAHAKAPYISCARKFSHYHETRSTFLFLKKHYAWALPIALIVRTMAKLILLPLRKQWTLLPSYFQGVRDALYAKSKKNSIREKAGFNKICILFYAFMLNIKCVGVLKNFSVTLNYLKKRLILKFFSHPHFKASQIEFLTGLASGNRRAIHKAQNIIGNAFDARIDIRGKYTCYYKQQSDFTDNKVAIVAHEDPEQYIDPYVEYVCLYLKNIGFKVILSSAGSVQHNAVLERKKNWADAIVCGEHEGLELTSYKAAFACFPSLYACKEILLTNDKYFGPFGDLLAVHKRMETISCDFWGLSYSEQNVPHLQNYYLLLKRSVIQHKAWKRIVNAISLENAEKNQEIAARLGMFLTLNNFQGATYAKPSAIFVPSMNPHLAYCEHIIPSGLALILRETIYSEKGLLNFFSLNKEGMRKPWTFAHDYIVRKGSLPNTATDINYDICTYNTIKQYENFPQSVLAIFEKISIPHDITSHKLNNMSLAVIIHCFYVEKIDTILTYMKNIPDFAHVYITTDTEKKKTIIEEKFKKFTFSFFEVRICPNRGFDMAPFFVGLKDVLLQYEYLLKIHIKNSMYMHNDITDNWRKILYESLMGSKEIVQGILYTLQIHSRLGLVAPPSYPPCALVTQGINQKKMHWLLQKNNIQLPSNACIDFPVGGMFWCRSEVLQPWLKLDLSYNDFQGLDSLQSDGTLAHALERVMFFGCGLMEKTWTRISD